MSSDIILNENSIDFIGSPLSLKNGEDADPNIELHQEWGTLNLGGGDAKHSSEGDLKLLDPDGDPVIHFSASESREDELGAVPQFDKTNVYIEGENGSVVTPTLRCGVSLDEAQEYAAYLGGWSTPMPEGAVACEKVACKSVSVTELHARSSVTAELFSGSELVLGHGDPDSETQAAGDLIVNDEKGQDAVKVDGNNARLELGWGNSKSDGDVVVHNKGGKETIHLGGNDARIELGHKGGNDGDVFVHNKDGKETIHLGGNDARIELGHEGGGNDGDVFVHDKDGNRTIHLNGADGTVKAKSVDTQSDARCKEDIGPIGEPSEKLAQLRGVSFQWKEEACGSVGESSGRNLGLIAQEVEEILPEVVSQDDEGYYSVAYGEVVPVLVEALKEQRQTIEEQQETISKLRDETEEMQKALDTAEERAQRLESVEERLVKLEEALESQPV